MYSERPIETINRTLSHKKTGLTTSAKLDFMGGALTPSGCLKFLTTLFESYCTECVNVTQSRFKEFVYEIGKILNMVSSEHHRHRTPTNQGRSQNHKTANTLSMCPWVRVDLAHVEDGSQATQRRKRFHHNIMYNLRNRSVSRYVVVPSSLTSSKMSPGVSGFGFGSLPR